MEGSVVLAYLAGLLLIYILGRMFLWPLKWIFKLIYNGLVGALILTIVNYIGSLWGFTIGINAFTALVVGFLGIPGVVLLILVKIFIV